MNSLPWVSPAFGNILIATFVVIVALLIFHWVSRIKLDTETCPKCGAKVKVDREQIDTTEKCPRCHADIEVTGTAW